jgi:hypothetical protein
MSRHPSTAGKPGKMPGPVFDCRAWGIGGLRNGRERDGGGAKALPTPSACFRAAPPTIPFPRTSNGDTFAAMPGYRRMRIPGGTYFFTVALRDRRAEWLVTEVEELRAAVRATRTRHPFTSMPRWCCRTTCTARGRCPRDGSDFPRRWMMIKAEFSKSRAPSAGRLPSLVRKRERGVGQRR